MITLTNVSFSYGNQPLIENLSFQAKSGECIVLRGANGSGKSTVLALIAGILKPKSGTVSAEGGVGFVPQGTALFEDQSVEENLRFFARLKKTTLPEPLPFGLDPLWKKRVSKLSGGMKKRLSIVIGLLGDPENLLLDEPASGLDLRFREELATLILEWKARGKTIVYVSHDPGEYDPYADEVIDLGSDA